MSHKGDTQRPMKFSRGYRGKKSKVKVSESGGFIKKRHTGKEAHKRRKNK